MVFNKKFPQLIFIALLALVLLPSFLQGSKAFVFAQDDYWVTIIPSPIPTSAIIPGKIKNLLVPDIFQGDISLMPLTLNNILNKIVIILLIVSSITFFFIIIIGGIRWMTAGGDKEKIAGAKQQLTSAAIGLAITLLVFTIANLIKLLFGINLLQFNIPTL